MAIGLTIAGTWPKSGANFLAHLVMLQDYTASVFVPVRHDRTVKLSWFERYGVRECGWSIRSAVR